MVQDSQFASRLILVPKRKRIDPFIDPLAELERVRALEIKAALAELRMLRTIERRNRFVGWLVDCWPVAAGLILGTMAPTLQALVASYAPWAMNLFFPFVVLAGRHQLHLSPAMAHYLPLVMLYAQFPIEGLLARRVLKRHITLSGVAVQLSFYHFLGAVQILLVSGTLRQLLLQ